MHVYGISWGKHVSNKITTATTAPTPLSTPSFMPTSYLNLGCTHTHSSEPKQRGRSPQNNTHTHTHKHTLVGRGKERNRYLPTRPACQVYPCAYSQTPSTGVYTLHTIYHQKTKKEGKINKRRPQPWNLCMCSNTYLPRYLLTLCLLDRHPNGECPTANERVTYVMYTLIRETGNSLICLLYGLCLLSLSLSLSLALSNPISP